MQYLLKMSSADLHAARASLALLKKRVALSANISVALNEQAGCVSQNPQQLAVFKMRSAPCAEAPSQAKKSVGLSACSALENETEEKKTLYGMLREQSSASALLPSKELRNVSRTKLTVEWICNECQTPCIPVRDESRCLW